MSFYSGSGVNLTLNLLCLYHVNHNVGCPSFRSSQFEWKRYDRIYLQNKVECDLMMSTDMDVPAKGFWRGNKSVAGKVPQEREEYEHHVSDESRKETTEQVSQVRVDLQSGKSW